MVWCPPSLAFVEFFLSGWEALYISALFFYGLLPRAYGLVGYYLGYCFFSIFEQPTGLTCLSYVLSLFRSFMALKKHYDCMDYANRYGSHPSYCTQEIEHKCLCLCSTHNSTNRSTFGITQQCPVYLFLVILLPPRFPPIGQFKGDAILGVF